MARWTRQGPSQLVRRTRPNALLLSTAGTDNHPQLSPLFHWFRRNFWMINPEEERDERARYTTKELSGPRATRIQELLRVADLGITGATVVKEGPGQDIAVRTAARLGQATVPSNSRLMVAKNDSASALSQH